MQIRSDPVEAVVFDFGGVFTASPIAAARCYAEQVGVDGDGLVELMVGNYAEDADHPWQRVERGELSLDDARVWARLESRHRLGVEIDPIHVMEMLMREPIRTSMVELASRLRGGGIKTGLLTNNARELRTSWRSLTDWSAIFDCVVDSSEVGVRKPDAAAFELALAQLDQDDPSKAVMVDDFAVNIDGARAIGMRGVLVGDDPAPAMALLEELVR